jgi:surfeit locus 1 family protein
MFWPTLATIAGLAILLGLGTWQLQRLRWKEDLIAKLATRMHAAPVDLAPVLASAQSGGDVEYTHTTATGQFRHDLERYVYVPGQGDWGYHVLTPLVLGDGRAILVNRGYVPRTLLDPAKRAGGLQAGTVSISGLLRAAPPTRPWYIPAADAKTHTWSWPEIADIAGTVESAGLPTLKTHTMDADAAAGPTPPLGGATRLELSNRHLEYALTWFALAATLAGLFLFAQIRHIRTQRG